ncbi:MAG: response regulator [Dysgonamonadaceae bacterium]|jgi:signal transduction histidine kinase/ligand-binding sensor domain-containing protein/CheY-like chemotaxis protein|nr:response regulator [Dysgonamonadaceae bacterium]
MKLSVIIFSVFTFLPSLQAQSHSAHIVQRLSTINGLPTNEVTQCYQDKEGYIWFATYDGLCRYDSYQIKTYKSNLYAPGLLSSNKLTAIAEDGNHQIWIGTDNGLNVLDKTTGLIRKIPLAKLKNNTIQSILTTKNNDVWIGTANGLHMYLAQQDTFIYFNNANTNYRMRGNDIKSLIEDAKGHIWIGTWNEGITRLDVEKGIFYPYPRINPANSAHVLFEDSQHTIWVGSWGYGLFRLENPYDPDKTSYINYSLDKKHSGSISDNIVYSISQDLNTNYIWAGTRSGLSVLFDRENPYSFTNFSPGESVLPYNEINSIIRDQSGLMWLGTLGGGIFTISSDTPKFSLNSLNPVKKKIASNSVRSLFIDGKGVIWMGIGSYGLVSFFPEKDQYVYYEEHPDFRENPIVSTVNMTIQCGDDLWFATNGQGIFVYNPNLHKVENIKSDTHTWLNSNMVLYMKEDSSHKIWIGTNRGICIYTPQTGEGFAYPRMGQKINGHHYTVYCIAEGDNNTMWAATKEHGVFRIKTDAATFKVKDFFHYSVENNQLNNDNLQYVYKDVNGKIWIGSEGGGLSCYNSEKDIFVCVQKEYNIPGDIVFNITEDRQGNLWLGTNAGLVALKAGVVQQYTIADGLQDNLFTRNAVFRKPDGELYFGGHKGYNHFYSAELNINKFCAPIVITDIKIYNESLGMMTGKLRKTISVNAPGYTQKVCLPDDCNNFSIEFANLNYAKSAQSKYAYQLKGFDKEWQYTDASRRFAFYTNLKSGVYQFQIKALNESGVWSNCETLQVEILPPFYLTWWAYLIYCSIVLLIFYFIVKISQHKITINNTIHIKNMEKQKIEELNNAKLQFFTNITHEFLTPLTILSASVDELKIVSPQHRSYYEVMSSNINRLIRLLQQILEFRKAETGNLKLKVSKNDIATFAKNCVENFYPVMKKNKIHLSIVSDPETIPAYFDHDKLDKILFNLLSNASKYNKPGGFVLVNVNYDGNTTDRICISVKDNGEGIKQSELKGLFKRFYEGNYRRFNTIGTGIGLSLTKDLVELHKGNISVESEDGKGTAFYVRIPIVRESFDETEIDEYTYQEKSVPENMNEKENEEPETPKEYSLLLIEDNEELLEVMVKLLRREYNIYTASNGREGVEILEQEDIDLTISDIMMPVMDGIELCRYVKNKLEISHVPIILLTAKNKEEDRIDAYDSGADGFISKPFNLNVLHSKIKNLLKAKERKAKNFKKQVVFEVNSLTHIAASRPLIC